MTAAVAAVDARGDVPFQCPTCGAEIPLRHVGVALYVCPFCHATCAVAEGGLAPGDVRAALLEPEGAFEVGAHGTLSSVLGGGPFEVAGRARYDADEGGWEEWLLILEGGRWAVAECSEGSWLLFTERHVAAPTRPARQVGDRLELAGHSILVNEVGRARLAAGRGGLSAPFAAGQSFDFAVGTSEHRVAKVAVDGRRSLLSLGRPADADDFELG